jgi:hypothetical protein
MNDPLERDIYIYNQILFAVWSYDTTFMAHTFYRYIHNNLISTWSTLPKEKFHEPPKTLLRIYRVRTYMGNSLMTLCKGANSLELQVQSVIARVNFPHEGTRGLISNSWGTVKKAPIFLLQITCKTISLSCVPNSTKWLSSTRCKCK